MNIEKRKYIIDKCQKVLKSCTNLNHLDGAENFINLAKIQILQDRDLNNSQRFNVKTHLNALLDKIHLMRIYGRIKDNIWWSNRN